MHIQELQLKDSGITDDCSDLASLDQLNALHKYSEVSESFLVSDEMLDILKNL